MIVLLWLILELLLFETTVLSSRFLSLLMVTANSIMMSATSTMAMNTPHNMYMPSFGASTCSSEDSSVSVVPLRIFCLIRLSSSASPDITCT
uniref:Putative secreted protein n=1 Tax=Panstrongylus lignarius TaxID=156445 RepID=A0A224Y247_9HEMI